MNLYSLTIHAMFPALSDIQHVLLDENACIDFLFEKHILDVVSACSKCGSSVKREGKRFRCRNRACWRSTSIFNNSFFSGSKIKCNDVMMLLYLFHAKTPSNTIHLLTGHSEHTVADYRRYYMQLLASSLDDEDMVIGGPGVVVEIDECKLGKRKYNRGHRVKGVWMLVGVEKTEERKLFIETIADRSAETIMEVISRHLLPGSIVHTDFWKSYLGLHELGMTHGRVNHSKHFRDPATGVNTNTVEGTNNGIKMTIAPRNRNFNHVEDYLSVFIWRRLHEKDLWGAFLSVMSQIAYIDNND